MRNHELFSVKTIPGEYKKLFGRDCDLFDVIELLPIVLRKTHAVPPEYVFIQDKVKDFKIITPCLYYSVKYVTTVGSNPWGSNLNHVYDAYDGVLLNYNLEEWQNSMAEANGDVVVNQIHSTAIKVNSNFPKKSSGTYMDFKARGNVISLPYNNIDVNILLTVMPVDDSGYPLVTEQVITAMAYFMNMVHIQKQYYSQKVPKYLFDDARNDSDKYLGEAMTPQAMSENEINDIMNALATFNRHSVNQPYRY